MQQKSGTRRGASAKAYSCIYLYKIDSGQMSVFWHLTLIFFMKYYIIKCGMFICKIWRSFCEKYSFSFNFKRRFL